MSECLASSSKFLIDGSYCDSDVPNLNPCNIMQPYHAVRIGLAEGSSDSGRERPEFGGPQRNWLFPRREGATRLNVLRPDLSVLGRGPRGETPLLCRWLTPSGHTRDLGTCPHCWAEYRPTHIHTHPHTLPAVCSCQTKVTKETWGWRLAGELGA